MSGPVAVLAVLDALIRMPSVVVNLDGDQIIRPAIINTRDAVAELIELVLRIDDECRNTKPNFGRVVKLAADAASLARLRGEA